MQTAGLIRSTRQARRLSQEQLGELVGVTQQAVDRWERLGVIPRPATAGRIERALGLAPGTLNVAPVWAARREANFDRRNGLTNENGSEPKPGAATTPTARKEVHDVS